MFHSFSLSRPLGHFLSVTQHRTSGLARLAVSRNSFTKGKTDTGTYDQMFLGCEMLQLREEEIFHSYHPTRTAKMRRND
jgi:hypothetical protein